MALANSGRSGVLPDVPGSIYNELCINNQLNLVAVKPLGNMIILVFVFCCFWPAFGKKMPQNPVKGVRLEKQCRTHLKLGPQINHEAISWLIPGPSQKLK